MGITVRVDADLAGCLTGAAVRGAAYACRPGEAHSAVTLNSEPTPREWELLRSVGLEPARVGRPYRQTVACPVNGDGYWYTRRELLDASGVVVGSVRDDAGPSGEL